MATPLPDRGGVVLFAVSTPSPAFVPNNPATGAGILPATTTTPQFPTGNATAPVSRDWRAP